MFRRKNRELVDRSFLEGILLEVGFPPTDSNVDAVALLAGKMMLADVANAMRQTSPGMAEDLLSNNRWNGKTADKWPSSIQTYLDALDKFLGPSFVDYTDALPGKVRNVLLESATEPGSFFDRPRSESLPLDWRS